MKRRLAAAAAAIAVVAASAVAMQGTSEAAVLPNNFKSVGYMPSWAGSVLLSVGMARTSLSPKRSAS